MTRERLSELADIGEHFIGNIERGEDMPSLKALLRLANALKVDTAYFFQAPDVVLPKARGKRERLIERLMTWCGQADVKSLELLVRIAGVIEKE